MASVWILPRVGSSAGMCGVLLRGRILSRLVLDPASGRILSCLVWILLRVGSSVVMFWILLRVGSSVVMFWILLRVWILRCLIWILGGISSYEGYFPQRAESPTMLKL
jgi:hypothetical protein